MKRFMKAVLGIASIGWFCAIQADDLLQVYQQALHNDPTFAQAQSTWWSEKQALPIAVAAYLPQVTSTDTLLHVWSKTPTGSTWYNQNALTLTATQAIFNYSAWTNIREQAANVKSATATYFAAVQSLMQRTVTAYLNVLAAYDKLRFTLANKESVHRQLVTAQQKFKVGLIAITGVYDAQASYDQAVADEISDRNNLYNQLENLQAITGQHYVSLKGIADQVPLINPEPNSIDAWVGIAEQQNYSLQADNYAAIAAHENIFNQASALLPTVNATTSYTNANNTGTQNSVIVANGMTQGANYGLSLSWTPFSGGSTYYGTKQARYDYVTALGALEATHRSVVSQTRQAFLGVIAGISRIQADKQTIISAQNALKATEAGYSVGTRTMVDVLDALTQLYSSENAYTDDQYAYINSIIMLKQQAGTLSVKDVAQLNQWLDKEITLPLPKDYYSSTSAL